MNGNVATAGFVGQIMLQLVFLHNEDYGYSGLNVYVAGVEGPWEFGHGSSAGNTPGVPRLCQP